VTGVEIPFQVTGVEIPFQSYIVSLVKGVEKHQGDERLNISLHQQTADGPLEFFFSFF